jgi:hypothetical protein
LIGCWTLDFSLTSYLVVLSAFSDAPSTWKFFELNSLQKFNSEP